jgi:putative ABC transport system permease protein
VLVVDIAAAQTRLGAAQRLTRVDVRLNAGATVAALHAAWQAAGGGAFPQAKWHQAQNEAQALSALSRAYRVNLTVLALVALFVGTFLVFSVLALSVAQRTPQFALLGVLGLTARERQRLVLLDAGVTGLLGAVAGVALGLGLSAAALHGLSGDLGGGYFAGVAPELQVDAWACFGFGGLGLGAALVGGWLPAQRVRGLSPAQALKGLGGVPSAGLAWWVAPSCLVLGLVLALLPPWDGLPVAAYAAVACLLLGGMAGVPPVVRLLVHGAQQALQRAVLHRPQWVPLWLAVWRADHDRQEATVAVAGVVTSLSLAVALTVMVASFRDSVSAWLDQVLPADLYARTATRSVASDGAYLPEALVQTAAALPGVARLEATRLRTLRLSPERPPVTLIARPLNEVGDPAKRLPLITRSSQLLPAGMIGVWVSEAVVALHGAEVGQRLHLPLGPQGQTEVMVLGVWRDYARQFGAVAIDRADYQALTGDTRANDLALWLHPQASADAVMAGLRRLGQSEGDPDAPNLLEFAQPGQIRTQSLRIFDRSFAVTHYLQALAMGIGLFGIAASFSAQVLARRREFGLLAHLGLTRRQIIGMVGAEGLVWTVAGAIWGLALGLAVAMVLVFVVNPQSFHWRMSLSLPPDRLAVLMMVVVLAGSLTAAWSARRAAAISAVRAVKEEV